MISNNTKGYSMLVIENPTPTKESSLGKHTILWYWFIFALIATLVGSLVLALEYFSNVYDHNVSCFVPETQDWEGIDEKNSESMAGHALLLLSNLNEWDQVQGDVLKSWEFAKDTPSQHFCSLGEWVDKEDFVITKFEISQPFQEGSSRYVFNYFVPSEYKGKAFMAIDNRINGTGANCNVTTKISEPDSRQQFTLTLVTQPSQGFEYTILMLGQNKIIPRSIKDIKDSSDEDYVY